MTTIREYYIPKDEDGLSAWAGGLNSATENTENTTPMGWDATDVAAIQGAASNIMSAVAAKDAARQTWMAVNSSQDTVISAALDVIRPLVAQGKTKPTATEAVQKKLGVWGTEHVFNPNTYVAELRSLEGLGDSMLEVKFSKANGALSAANLYLRKTGEADWTMVATMLRTPFFYRVPLATPGMPESYEARVRGLIGNEEVGSPSAAQTVLVD